MNIVFAKNRFDGFMVSGEAGTMVAFSTTSYKDQRKKMEQEIRDAVQDGPKCGATPEDNFRMDMSVLEVDDRVWAHPQVGPLHNGFPGEVES